MKQKHDSKFLEEIDKIQLTIEDEAKAIVLWAFRGCPTLEYIHAGREKNFPEDISRIKEAEMKTIMKFAVDEVHYILWLKENHERTYKALIKTGSFFTSHWDKPRDPIELMTEHQNRIGQRK